MTIPLSLPSRHDLCERDGRRVPTFGLGAQRRIQRGQDIVTSDKALQLAFGIHDRDVADGLLSHDVNRVGESGCRWQCEEFGRHDLVDGDHRALQITMSCEVKRFARCV